MARECSAYAARERHHEPVKPGDTTKYLPAESA